MTEYHIRYDDGYQVYATETGIDQTDRGPKWPTPRSAGTYVDTLYGRHNVSPLRTSVEDAARPPAAFSTEALTGLGS